MTKNTTKPNFGAHAPWKSKPVLWVTRDGVLHVARFAATSRHGITSKVLCGGGANLWPEGTTWYDMKRRGHRFCRRCTDLLAAEGEGMT